MDIFWSKPQEYFKFRFTKRKFNKKHLVDKTHREIGKIQNTQNSADIDFIEEDKTSITKLGRKLSQWTYSVKNKSVGFQIKILK